MKFRDFLAATAACALASAPVAAQAADAPVARDRAAVEGEEIGGSFLFPLLAVVAVIVAIVLVTDDSDEPASP